MSHRKHKARRSQRPAAVVTMQSPLPMPEGPAVDVEAAAPELTAAALAAPEPAEAQPAPSETAAVNPFMADSVSIDNTIEIPEAESTMGEPDTVDAAVEHRRIGAAFHAARSEQGIELADAARRLRFPLRVLEKLESGDWSGIDSPLYLRGYLRSYSELLGVPTPVISATAPTLPAVPPLVSTTGIPRSHYLFRRYATAATYVGLTAIVVVPVVLLGLQGGLKQDLAAPVPLDPPAIVAAAPNHAAAATSVGVSVTTEPAPAMTPDDAKPLMASMAPMGLLARELDANAAPAAAAPATVPGTRSIDLHLDAPSWVEILGSDGARVEYALLQPGDHHYTASGALDVRLGNSQDAALKVDGEARDFASYKRANVAHFSIDAEGTVQPPQG